MPSILPRILTLDEKQAGVGAAMGKFLTEEIVHTIVSNLNTNGKPDFDETKLQNMILSLFGLADRRNTSISNFYGKNINQMSVLCFINAKAATGAYG